MFVLATPGVLIALAIEIHALLNGRWSYSSRNTLGRWVDTPIATDHIASSYDVYCGPLV